MASEDEEANRRRKVLQEALEWTRMQTATRVMAMAMARTIRRGMQKDGDDDDDEDDDEEDDTAELLRELEKIQRERAAEQARVEQAEAEATEAEREARIATANPLLNLAAAFGNAPGIIRRRPAPLRSSDVGMTLRTPECHGIFTFLDLVFKNQAIGDKAQGQFVNNPLRTEFHNSAYLVSFTCICVLCFVMDRWMDVGLCRIPPALVASWQRLGQVRFFGTWRVDIYCSGLVCLVSQENLLHAFMCCLSLLWAEMHRVGVNTLQRRSIT